MGQSKKHFGYLWLHFGMRTAVNDEKNKGMRSMAHEWHDVKVQQ